MSDRIDRAFEELMAALEDGIKALRKAQSDERRR